MKDYEKNYFSGGKPFGVFISGLGQYNEGELTGKWFYLPATKDEWKDAMSAAGIGKYNEFGSPYEEYFISDTDVYVDGLRDYIGEYTNLESLQLLAEKIQDMDAQEYEAFCAYLEVGDVNNLDEVYSVACQADELDGNNLYIYPEVHNTEDLGYYVVDEIYGGPENIKNDTIDRYFDYEALGRDLGFDSYDVDNYSDYEDMLDGELDFEVAFYVNKDDAAGYLGDKVTLEEALGYDKFDILIEDNTEDILDVYTSIKDVSLNKNDVQDLIEYLKNNSKNFGSKDNFSQQVNDLIFALNEYNPEDEYRSVTAGEYFCEDPNASDLDIGYAYVHDVCGIEGVAEPSNYFDYERYGRDIELDTTGYYTDRGYVEIVKEVDFNDELKQDLNNLRSNNKTVVPSFDDMRKYHEEKQQSKKKSVKDSIKPDKAKSTSAYNKDAR